MLYLLLSEGAKRAKSIISEFKPKFASKSEYLTFIDSLSSCGDRIKYIDGDSAEVVLK